MFCGKCGKQLEDEAVVCPWCGAPTGVEVGPEIPQQKPGHGRDGYRSVEKTMTSFGISVGLVAMIIYFSGLVNSTILVLVSGCVLLKEKDRWLRAVAAKAMLLTCMFGLISAGLTTLDNGISGLNYLVMSMGAGSLNRMAVQDFCSFLDYVCMVVRDVIFFIAGIQAFNCNNFKVAFIDRMINRNIQK